MKRLSEEQISEAIHLYTAGGLSYKKIGDRFGVSDNSIRGLLKRRGVTPRTLSESHRRIECNHGYFGQMLDEQRAYWIGFLLADGGITKRSYGQTNRVTCRLAPCDIGHLRKLLSALGSGHKITDVGHQGVQLSISSSEMVQDLSKHHVSPRKSANHQFSKAIPENLLKHYFRGYFDGNGGISRHRSSKWSINCAAGENFLIAFRDWIGGQIGGHPAKISFADGIHRIAWAGTHRCREILDLMYHDASIYLERKMLKYEQVVNDAESSSRTSYNRK